MSFVSSQAAGDENPHVDFTESSDHGVSWTTPRRSRPPGTAAFIPRPPSHQTAAPSTSCTTPSPRPYQTNTSSPRELVGVVKKGTVSSGVTGSWSTLDRGASRDAAVAARYALTAEFLGGCAVRRGHQHLRLGGVDMVPAMPRTALRSTPRENLVQGITPNPAPNPPTSCGATSTFGNSDIYSFSSAP